MVTANDTIPRSSVHVAPLSVPKDRARGSSEDTRHKRNTSSRSSTKTSESSTNQSQMTPPATPNSSQEDLSQHLESHLPVFHNFLRAFYPFNPTYTISDSTVTLPLNEGDVILVHSIHTNGWADGTLLASGARGWLPTNYCEAYGPHSMQNLLMALLHFWDLLRSGMNIDGEVFGNQEFMRGIIAGVRSLLEKSNCLTRESTLVQSNEGLRRHRKALLSDLSSLVKTAKRLQECTATLPQNQYDSDDINNTIDEMILKAFKIVTRGVRFLDVLDDDVRTRHPVHRVMATVAEEAYNPPTPPADATSFEGTQHGDPAYDAASRRSSSRSSASGLPTAQQFEEQTKRQSYKRMLGAYSANAPPPRPLSMTRPSSVQLNRQSVSHRLSLTASIPAAQRQNLVSERLNVSHDTFLSFLGSFIGRLHLQSQSALELLSSVRQCMNAGHSLLMVVEAICAHDNQSADALEVARDAMYDRINRLAAAARDIVKASGVEDENVVMRQQNEGLLTAATGCVKAAGECVAKTKFVIERIGDFEFEFNSQGLGIDIPSIGSVVDQSECNVEVEPSQPEPASRPPPPPLIIPSYEKPLPDVPLASPPVQDTNNRLSAGNLEPVVQNGSASSATASSATASSATASSTWTDSSSRSSTVSILPPLPKLTSPLLNNEDYSPSEPSSGHDSEYQPSYRKGSGISSTGTNSTYLSSMRDSELSLISQASTRATTPDSAPYVPRSKPSLSEMSATGSHSTLADDSAEEGESKMLEKTFAHELLHNKDGQITGGSLPALVERLTTHDSTPDAMFVSTFYLTFRLFVTPIELATALVERFEYVAESPHIAGPVRLRVYNVFKGWLESHWRDLSDHDSLVVIEPFAKETLGKILPAAGRRLLELAQKVTSTEGPLVPRLVSSIGKTSTSISQYIPADTPLPPSALTKSQVGVLKNWKMGGSNPTILDFDPLELARQLTIKEMNIFCAIMPEELLGSEWTKRSGSNAVNVRAMSTLSTDLSNLVADTILQYEDMKKRAVIIKHWIKIAHRCLELNNYDSLMAIICSLNSSTIVRLKKTWDVVSQRRKEMLKGLQAIVEPDKNYATLRKRLHDHVPPCLPFVGTYLTDLTFVDAGNPATKQLPGVGDSDGMAVINFDKHTRTAKIIGELQRFQIPHRLAEVPEMQEWIQAQIVRVKSTSEHENVQQFYRKSLLLEPRENLPPKGSPIEGQNSFPPVAPSKEKFDIFAWTHSKDKATIPATPI
ncbi:Ras guanine nucleotide exchange factor A [Lachnellula subtilissima]|uniref:Ras guanine nucleotide exchange factor A n=1 Tax=Lachnellula subtilissima TaxID=602034 RepID=A0A8H8U803_9HELO|nr:Ras guanine nucleotide exchange factor A [Lachnellula subtilissima]